MNSRRNLVIGLFLTALLSASGIYLLGIGLYGWTVFVLFPMGLGALSTLVVHAETGLKAARNGGLAGIGAALLLLGLGWEGLICIAMAVPLVVPLGALGGWVAYSARHSRVAARELTILFLLPAVTLTWDVKAPPPVYAVTTRITVAASPEQVWKHVIAFSALPEPKEWFFRAGVAYPERARIEGSGPGAVRYCEFSTGPFVEPITVWDEPHLLRFRVTANPAPLREWNPFQRLEPRHLHGYLVSKQGQFRLTPLPNGQTLLEGTTWYQHGLWPAEYWRWWSDAIIHRIHLRVLEHVRALAEQDARRASPLE